MKKKVLITGATGFIGQHCIPILMRHDFDVFATYRNKILEGWRDSVTWIQVDLLNDQSVINSFLESNHVDFLLHLAWDVTPKQYKNSPNNLKWLSASLELINSFIQNGGKRIVTAGTCFEYDFSGEILKEDTTPLRPDTLYGECKVAMFKVAQHYCNIKNVGYAHGRIFYLFGPGDDVNKVIPYVAKALLNGEDATCSSGLQRLDYLYVKDVASAFVRILESDLQGPVNIGSGQGFLLRGLLEGVEALVSTEHKIIFDAPKPTDQQVIVADIERLKDELQWSASFNLQDGLKEFAEWVKNYRQ